MNRYKALAAAAFALLFAAACGSSGIGDIFGGGTNNTNNSTYDIRGTVDSVDLNSRSIYLTSASGYNTSLASGGGGQTVRVYYNDQTPVEYQGRTYRPQDLERGDEVTIRADQSGNQLIAQSMSVTYNARGSMTSSGSLPSGSILHGTIRSIDTYGRTISIDRGFGGSYLTISYDANTPVYFIGRTYAAKDLETGDEVDIRTTDLGGGRLGAQDFTVTRNISNSGTSGSSTSSTSTIRGTFRSLDTYNHTIILESTSWMSGFKTTTGNTMTVQYDASTRVDYQGQLQPLTNLERGDVVDVQVRSTGGSSYFAQRIILVRDVNVH